jgi:hypothetical protein
VSGLSKLGTMDQTRVGVDALLPVVARRLWQVPALCIKCEPVLPPWRNRPPLVYPAHWLHSSVLGPDHLESDSACGHVLVLLPERTWHPHLVEGVNHPSADHPVRH